MNSDIILNNMSFHHKPICCVKSITLSYNQVHRGLLIFSICDSQQIPIVPVTKLRIFLTSCRMSHILVIYPDLGYMSYFGSIHASTTNKNTICTICYLKKLPRTLLQFMCDLSLSRGCDSDWEGQLPLNSQPVLRFSLFFLLASLWKSKKYEL